MEDLLGLSLRASDWPAVKIGWMRRLIIIIFQIAVFGPGNIGEVFALLGVNAQLPTVNVVFVISRVAQVSWCSVVSVKINAVHWKIQEEEKYDRSFHDIVFRIDQSQDGITSWN